MVGGFSETEMTIVIWDGHQKVLVAKSSVPSKGQEKWWLVEMYE